MLKRGYKKSIIDTLNNLIHNTFICKKKFKKYVKKIKVKVKN